MLWPNALHVPHGDVRQRWLSPAEILIWYEAQRREAPGQKLKDIFRAWSGFLEVSEVMLHGRK